MNEAMHKKTKIGCELLVQQAINECPISTIQRYISRNFAKNTHQWALWARQHSPLLLQVTSTNALESYHSELKRTTSPQHGLIGACHKVSALDVKKRSDSDYVAFEFHTKKISAVGVDHKVLNEIHKFPFPIQQMIITEVFAVERRIEKGKGAPGLLSLDCYCLFFCQYLLPCRHIFHEHMYGSKKLLIVDAWEQFQQMFEESRFEIYEHRELVEVEISEKTEAKRATENRRQTVNELMERTRDVYWRVEEKGNAKKTVEFISELSTCLEPILRAKKSE